jgi:hypothetical protein
VPIRPNGFRGLKRNKQKQAQTLIFKEAQPVLHLGIKILTLIRNVIPIFYIYVQNVLKKCNKKYYNFITGIVRPSDLHLKKITKCT